MRLLSHVLMAGVVAVLVCGKASAVVPHTRNDPGAFDEIRNRNVFGLRPPQQPVVSNPPSVLPKLVLQGITTILGNKRALLKEEPPTQPGLKAPAAAATQDLSMILTEGQRQGDVEVLQIDEKAGRVKVNNSGTVITLTFEKDGAKLPSSPGTNTAAVAAGFAAPGTTALTHPSVAGGGIFPPTNATGTARRSTTRWPMNAAQTSSLSPPGGNPTPAVPPLPTASDVPAGLTSQEQAIISEVQNATAQPNVLPPRNVSPEPNVLPPSNLNPATSTSSNGELPPAPEGMTPAFVPRPPALPNRLLPQ